MTRDAVPLVSVGDEKVELAGILAALTRRSNADWPAIEASLAEIEQHWASGDHEQAAALVARLAADARPPLNFRGSAPPVAPPDAPVPRGVREWMEQNHELSVTDFAPLLRRVRGTRPSDG
jgi:hypothetical protein